MAKNDRLILSIILLAGALAVSFITGYHAGLGKDKETVKTDTTIVVSSYHSPKPVKEVGIGKVDVPIIVYKDTKSGEKEVKCVPSGSKGSSKDTFRVQVPITQKVYRDSNYTAYVSGFNASLDSINVESKAITYTKTVTKRNAFNIGLTGGVGYGLINRKPDVYVGLGFTWRLFK